MPGAQLAQLAAPVLGCNLPAGQDPHTLEPVEAANLPLAHDAQPDEPSDEKVPTAQALHAVAWTRE